MTILLADPCDYAERSSAPVAVLFSGGLDSMILAAILDECLDTKYQIDLLNVSFDRESAPDRISVRQGMKELYRIPPLGRNGGVSVLLKRLYSEASILTRS